MALNAQEVQRLQTLSDELAKLVEDKDATSNEASVAYGKIGRICARALAVEAAAAAKRGKRDEHVKKFQAARQTRLQKKGGAGTTSPAQSA